MPYPIAASFTDYRKHPFEPCENSCDLIRHPLGQEYIRRFLVEQQALFHDRCKARCWANTVDLHHGILPEMGQLFTGVEASEKYFDRIAYDPVVSWQRIQQLHDKFLADVASGDFEKFLRTAPSEGFRVNYCVDREAIIKRIPWIVQCVEEMFTRIKDLHQQLDKISKRHNLVANTPDSDGAQTEAGQYIEYVKSMKGAMEIMHLESQFFEIVSLGYNKVLDNPSTGASGGF